MDEEDYLERIVVDSNICDGRPCVKGTRIEVGVVMDALAEGLSAEEIVDHYPALEKEDIRAAAAYAGELSREKVWKLTAS